MNSTAGSIAMQTKKIWKEFRYQVITALVPTLGYAYISLIANTAKTLDFGHEHHAELRLQYPQFIYVGWHEQVLNCAWRLRHRNIAILVSQSRDGEYLSRLEQLLGFFPVRGSSSRGGLRGLLQLDRAIKTGHDVMIGADGPKGPAKECKAGAIVLAKHSGMPLIPIAGYTQRATRLHNWDQTIVPYPFAFHITGYGTPILIPPDIDKDEIPGYQQQLKLAIDDLTLQARQRWNDML